MGYALFALGGATIRSRLRLYSFLLICLPLIILLLSLVLFLNDRAKDARVAEIRDNLAAQRNAIHEWIAEARRDLSFLARLDKVKSLDEQDMHKVFRKYLSGRDDMQGLLYAGLDGVISLATFQAEGVDIADRDYFQAGLAGVSSVSEVLVSRADGQPIIIISEPLLGQELEPLGIIFASVTLADVERLLERQHVGLSGDTFLLRRDGLLLSCSHNERGHDGDHAPLTPLQAGLDSELLERLIRTKDGVGFSNLYGESVFGAGLPVKGGEWVLVGEISRGELLDQTLVTAGVSLAAGLLSLLLATPVLLRLAESIERPLERLMDYTEQMVHSNDWRGVCVTPLGEAPREVKQLYENFCEMKDALDTTLTNLEESALTDPLTGLSNRRYLMREAPRVLEQAQRAEQPSACLMLDIDYFKSINDRYGHVVGDEVLAGVAACIKKTVRHSDIAVRFGGEEFCIIAPGADSETGATLAERIREVVENQCVEADSLPIKVTISIGVASLPAFAPIRRTMLDDLLGYADQALYDAKAMGRNRVVIAETGLE